MGTGRRDDVAGRLATLVAGCSYATTYRAIFAIPSFFHCQTPLFTHRPYHLPEPGVTAEPHMPPYLARTCPTAGEFSAAPRYPAAPLPVHLLHFCPPPMQRRWRRQHIHCGLPARASGELCGEATPLQPRARRRATFPSYRRGAYLRPLKRYTPLRGDAGERTLRARFSCVG